jgi:RNA polymerase I-specific transcription initiation factor RRN5
MWLQLSERFFMNFGESKLEDNWINLAYKGESPSITCDAFADFHAIAVSITRRLIQSSVFFALSRIRSMRSNIHQRASVVKARDVRAALRVLDMKRNSFEFWIGVARRCNLDVADIRHKKGWEAHYMNYNEVEDALSGRKPPAEKLRKRSAHPSPHRNSHDDSEEDGCGTEGSSGMDQSPTQSSISSLLSTSDEEAPSSAEDSYVEYIDRQKSRTEELRIQQLLQCPTSIGTEDNRPKSPLKSEIELISVKDLRDWRERTLYRSEWEEYGHDVHRLHEELIENRRKRRRIEGRESSTTKSCHRLNIQVAQKDMHDYDDGEDGAEGVVFAESDQGDISTDNSNRPEAQLDDEEDSELDDLVDADANAFDKGVESDEEDIDIGIPHPRQIDAISESLNQLKEYTSS